MKDRFSFITLSFSNIDIHNNMSNNNNIAMNPNSGLYVIMIYNPKTSKTSKLKLALTK